MSYFSPSLLSFGSDSDHPVAINQGIYFLFIWLVGPYHLDIKINPEYIVEISESMLNNR